MPNIDLAVEPALPATLTACETAELYARQADELAALIEAEKRRSAAMLDMFASALGEIHTAFDEIAALTVGTDRT